MTRPAYDELPAQVRSWVDGVLLSPVLAAADEVGGYSPGVAARVRCASERLAFVKAVSAEVNSYTVAMHRQEARVTPALPKELGSPRLLGCYDQEPWVVLVLAEEFGGWARLAHDSFVGLGDWELRHLGRLVELEDDWASAIACSSGLTATWCSSTGRGRGAERRSWTWWASCPTRSCEAGATRTSSCSRRRRDDGATPQR